MKKILMLLQLLVLLVMTQTALAMPSVLDDAQLLDSQEEAMVAEQLEKLDADYGIKVTIVTADSLEGMDIGDYADDLVNNYMEDGTQGTMALVQIVDSRKWYVSTDSRLRDTVGSDKAVKRISQAIVPHLKSGNYAQAYIAFAKEVGSLVDYYQAEAEKPFWEKEIDVNVEALLCALFVAFIFTKIIRSSLLSSMNNVQEAPAADDYLVKGSFELMESSDDYLYSTTVHTRRHKDRDNDHGGGGSSGGGNGGGGGSY